MRSLLGIQVAGILFALFMFYITFLHQKRNEFTVKESILWFGAWTGFLALVVFPNILDYFIIDALDFARRMDFFVVAGFMFLIGISFHTYTVMRKTQNKVDKLVRKIAIDKELKKK